MAIRSASSLPSLPTWVCSRFGVATRSFQIACALLTNSTRQRVKSCCKLLAFDRTFPHTFARDEIHFAGLSRTSDAWLSTKDLTPSPSRVHDIERAVSICTNAARRRPNQRRQTSCQRLILKICLPMRASSARWGPSLL